MKKSVFTFCTKCSGSVVTQLIAVSVLSFSTVSVFQYLKRQTPDGHPAHVMDLVSEIQKKALKAGKDILLKTDRAPAFCYRSGEPVRHIYGVCSWLSLSQGYDTKENTLSSRQSDQMHYENRNWSLRFVEDHSNKSWPLKACTWSKERLRLFFKESDWKVLSDKECRLSHAYSPSSGFRACLQYLKTKNSSPEERKIIYVDLHITPALLDSKIKPEKDKDTVGSPFGSSELKFISTEEKGVYSLAEVFFIIKVKVMELKKVEGLNEPETAFSKQNTGPLFEEQSYVISDTREATDIIWANQVEFCDTFISNHVKNKDFNRESSPHSKDKWYRLQSGGSGIDTYLDYMNGKRFLKSEKDSSSLAGAYKMEDLEIGDIEHYVFPSLNQEEEQETEEEGALSYSFFSKKNVALICKPERFSCGREKWKDGLRFSLSVNNMSETDYYFHKIWLRVKGVHGLISQVVPLNMENHSEGLLLRAQSGSRLHLEVEDEFCNKICSMKTTGSVYPVISVMVQNVNNTDKHVLEKDFSLDAGAQVYCLSCLTKSCRFPREVGERKPGESLDSQLPECLAKKGVSKDLDWKVVEDKQENQSKAAEQNMRASEPIKRNVDQCVALKASSLDSFRSFNSLRFHLESCDQKLPVLCFSRGYFRPALSFPKAGYGRQPGLLRVGFKDAGKACYGMGEVRGKASYLERWIKDSGKIGKNETQAFVSVLSRIVEQNTIHLKQSEEVFFRFINNVNRGFFLTPHPGYRLAGAIPDLLKEDMNKVINLGGNLWFALERDRGGMLVSSIPKALSAVAHPFSMYLDQSRDHPSPVLIEDRREMNFGGRHHVLAYNVRWKGLFPVSKEKEHHFVCRRKEGRAFFITQSQGTFDRAWGLMSFRGRVISSPGFFMGLGKVNAGAEPSSFSSVLS